MVNISDTELKKALKKEIGARRMINDSFDEKQLASIKYLDLNSYGIKSLEGLEYCEKLEVLYLANNPIKDISVLYSLKNLRYLDLSYNGDIDWSTLNRPLLSVEEVILRDCSLTTDSVLEFFPNVKEVSFFYNQIESIQTLYKLSQLNYVNLQHNLIPQVEIEAFCNLTGVAIALPY